jgi:hypothetical protein
MNAGGWVQQNSRFLLVTVKFEARASPARAISHAAVRTEITVRRESISEPPHELKRAVAVMATARSSIRELRSR